MQRVVSAGQALARVFVWNSVRGGLFAACNGMPGVRHMPVATTHMEVR
jgi:hypothetical protein